MKKIYVFVFLFITLLCFSCKSNKISKLDYKSYDPYMYGMVYDYDNKPVENAQIFINDELITSTDIQGRFILNYKRDDQNEFLLRIEKNLYEIVESKFTFDPLNVLYIRLINSQQLLLLAEEKMTNLNYFEAENLLQRALKLSSDRDDIKYLLCIALLKQEKTDIAFEYLKKIKTNSIPKTYIDSLERKINDTLK